MKRIVLPLFFLLVSAWLLPARRAFAQAEDPRDSSSPYGVLDFFAWDQAWNHFHYGDDKVDRAVALMKDAGIEFVRLDFPWAELEPQKGRFDFRRYDHILDLMQRNGLHALGILAYNPSWRSGDWNAAPVLEDYLAYARKIV